MNSFFKNSTWLLFLTILVAQPSMAQEGGQDKELMMKKLADSINNDPNNLQLHEQYLKVSGFTRWGAKEDTAFVNQYKRWMDKYPQSAVLPYALGHAFAGRESPQAKPYLLKAIELEPKMDKAYFDLWIDAERWGQFEKGREYIAKASEIKPDNADYAFYSASSSDRNSAKYTEMSLEVAKRFPESERGAQALYWLAVRSKNNGDKVRYFELLKEKFQPAKFRWSSSGMSAYFNLLLAESPQKAKKLAVEMEKVVTADRDKKSWSSLTILADDVTKANELLASNKAPAAIQILEKDIFLRWVNSIPELLLLKAKAYQKNQQTQKAYEQLLASYASNPQPIIGDALFTYGNLLKKNKDQVTREVWHIRDTASRKATDFSLNKYFSEGKASLADFKGKVILLTYWFPGCGPCRGEFPHFQNVVNKFNKNDLAYVGINIVPEQNDYVIPFLNSSGYTFLPLEDYEGRDKGNLDNGGAAPVNFLIDQKGNIIFKNFRTDGDNEDILYEMISSTIQRGKS